MNVVRPQYKHRLLDVHGGAKLQKKVNKMFLRMKRSGVLFWHEKNIRLQQKRQTSNGNG
jgi:hypothetical protein